MNRVETVFRFQLCYYKVFNQYIIAQFGVYCDALIVCVNTLLPLVGKALIPSSIRKHFSETLSNSPGPGNLWTSIAQLIIL